jgi:hypothetical protein
MEHTQKMVLSPYETEGPPVLLPSTDSSVQYTSEIPTQTAPQPVKRIRLHQSIERFKNQVRILLKLGKIDPVDNNLRIKNENGVFIENSNIINLLHYATQDAKGLVGQEAFIMLLFKAGVEPELILNQDIKSKLFKLYVQSKVTQTDNTVQSKDTQKDNTVQSNDTQADNEKEPQIYTQTSPEQAMEINPVVQSNKRQREVVEDDNDEESDESTKKKLKWIMPEND